MYKQYHRYASTQTLHTLIVTFIQRSQKNVQVTKHLDLYTTFHCSEQVSNIIQITTRVYAHTIGRITFMTSQLISDWLHWRAHATMTLTYRCCRLCVKSSHDEDEECVTLMTRCLIVTRDSLPTSVTPEAITRQLLLQGEADIACAHIIYYGHNKKKSSNTKTVSDTFNRIYFL